VHLLKQIWEIDVKTWGGWHRIGLLAWPLLLVCSGAGCGGRGDGPPRFHVSGGVNFGDEPIPAGMIVFSPDSSKGNNGPQGKARIEDGQYTTDIDGGKGVIGGPHKIRIFGADGVPYVDETGSEQPDGRPLFPPWECEVDLGDEELVHDFQVPLTASRSVRP
jgi:hypothetical protein